MTRRSPKRKAADERAYTIFRLRGAYALFEKIGSNAGMFACDDELKILGAEAETDRRRKKK